MVEDWVLTLAGSPWVFLALYAFAAIDGFFPPIPSETVVIALASLSVSTGQPDLWQVGVVAAAGAFTGDQIAYTIGRRIRVRELAVMRGERQQRVLAWAERALAERGATFIVAARYVPVGRIAVNMTAGAVRFPRRRFTGLVVVAAITWSIYSVLLGVGAGAWLGHNPLLGVAVGVCGGLLIGMALDPLLTRLAARRWGGQPPSTAPTVAEPKTSPEA